MLVIRPARPEDAGTIRKLIQGLAEYEHEPQSALATEEDLLRDGFGPVPKFHCLIAEWQGAPVGFALYFYNYSTWKGRPGIFLEDLFVWPEYRGKGIGKALLLQIAWPKNAVVTSGWCWTGILPQSNSTRASVRSE
jgi:GNAT superfamily N-acetyltransferase